MTPTNIEQLQTDIMGTREAVQRSYLLVLWVQVPPLQFSVWLISDSRWGDSAAESTEGLRTSQDDPTNDKDRSYNRKGKWKGGL